MDPRKCWMCANWGACHCPPVQDSGNFFSSWGWIEWPEIDRGALCQSTKQPVHFFFNPNIYTQSHERSVYTHLLAVTAIVVRTVL